MQSKLALIIIIALISLGSWYFLSNTFTPTSNQKTSDSSPYAERTSSTCRGIVTPSQTEGPYYKAGSPKRNNITEGRSGEKLTITGYVYDKDCKVIVNAWLDFWQTDNNGAYDNVGYKLRGHLYTDSEGKYTLETILPFPYEGRPPHIHVKVKPPAGEILTSQMYFPNSSPDKDLTIELSDGEGGKLGKFNFVLDEKVNIKASFKIITDGIERIFTDTKYHNRTEGVYIQLPDPSIVYVTKKGITWDDFFKTLPMKLTKDCLTTGTGQVFCIGEGGTLRFYLNDQEGKDLLDREIKDGDKILIQYN